MEEEEEEWLYINSGGRRASAATSIVKQPDDNVNHDTRYTRISRTTETVTSRPASPNPDPLQPTQPPTTTDQVRSQKVFRRNERLIHAFYGMAIYSWLLAVGSLLLGLVKGGGLLLLAVHGCVASYLVYVVKNRYFLAKMAPLRFLPALLSQGFAVGVVAARARMIGIWEKKIFKFQMSAYGGAVVVYLGYFIVLVLRSSGVQRLKTALPNYYVYLNITASPVRSVETQAAQTV
jgi:hypothetical protein